MAGIAIVRMGAQSKDPEDNSSATLTQGVCSMQCGENSLSLHL